MNVTEGGPSRCEPRNVALLSWCMLRCLDENKLIVMISWNALNPIHNVILLLKAHIYWNKFRVSLPELKPVKQSK